MALQIGDAVRRGIDDVLSENGLLIVAVFFLYNLANSAASSSFTKALFERLTDSGGLGGTSAPGVSISNFTGPFSLDFALPVAVVLALLFLVIGQLVKFWGIRLFADPGEIRVNNTSERAVMAAVLGGGVAVVMFAISMSSTVFNLNGQPLLGAAAGIASGLLSLIVGLAFVYLLQSIALYDGGYVETIKHCVARFMDAPAQIVILLLILALLGLIPGILGAASFLTAFLPFDLPASSLLRVASMALSAPVQAFSLAVITDAYLQVRADQDDDGL